MRKQIGPPSRFSLLYWKLSTFCDCLGLKLSAVKKVVRSRARICRSNLGRRKSDKKKEILPSNDENIEAIEDVRGKQLKRKSPSKKKRAVVSKKKQVLSETLAVSLSSSSSSEEEEEAGEKESEVEDEDEPEEVPSSKQVSSSAPYPSSSSVAKKRTTTSRQKTTFNFMLCNYCLLLNVMITILHYEYMHVAEL